MKEAYRSDGTPITRDDMDRASDALLGSACALCLGAALAYLGWWIPFLFAALFQVTVALIGQAMKKNLPE
jgi:CHASE2 domain-containing sensor protein